MEQNLQGGGKNPLKKLGNKWSTFMEDTRTRWHGFLRLSPREKGKRALGWLGDNALYLLILAFVLGVFFYNSSFLSFGSIVNILMQSASRLLMALGVAGIIVLTGTDLSAGRCLGLCACICASLLQANGVANKMFSRLTFSPALILLALLVSLLVGGAVGAFNGFMVSRFKLHPFIVTLGTQLILYGAVMWYVSLGQNNSAPIAGLAPAYTRLVTGGFRILGVQIPNYLWIVLGVTVLMWVVWNKTVLGKNMFAVGTNPEAAAVCGVNVSRTIVTVFFLAGLLYGASAFVECARVASNSTATGVNYELDAIAACVIGGVSFMGGIGKISGVVLGVFLLQLVNAGLVFLNFEPAVMTVVKGAIILIACAIDMRKYIAKR